MVTKLTLIKQILVWHSRIIRATLTFIGLILLFLFAELSYR